MNRANIDHIEMAYETAGQGVPVVLIHGHPFDHTMWDPQIKSLSEFYNVIAPDLRGYGNSSLPDPANTRFEDYAADVIRLMDHLNIGSFHLAGISLGGQLIMEMFRQAPDRIKSLIFADTFAGPDTPEAKKTRNEQAARLEKEGMEGYATEVVGKMIRREHVDSMPEVAAHMMKMMKGTSPIAAAAAMRARGERINYLTEVLPQINIPTLVIVGRQDEFTPVAKAEELQENLQNCKLVVIEDAGHMPNLEQFETFNETVLDFLENISTYPGRSF
ncbi:MAG: alpha/beta fold hydrolase [Mucilaginibacter sp.]